MQADALVNDERRQIPPTQLNLLWPCQSRILAYAENKPKKNQK